MTLVSVVAALVVRGFEVSNFMPIEEIRRILQERADQAAREGIARKEAEEKARRVREEAERQQREAEEKRRRFVIQQTEKIMRNSGVLDGLRRIEKELLEGNVSKHGISYSPENGKATLTWGIGFDMSADGGVKRQPGDNYNFSSLEVFVDSDKEQLTIQGAFTYQFSQNDWKDIEKIEKALAAAYVDPQREFPRPSGSSSSYDSSSDMGCCCGGNN